MGGIWAAAEAARSRARAIARMPVRRIGRTLAFTKRGAPVTVQPMAKLIYSAIASLDGYVADEHGNFDWAAPDEEVHAFVNDHERPIGTYLYGRRMYETMVVLGDRDGDEPPLIRDYAEIWRAADKVVFSRTLEAVVQRADADRARFDPGRPAAEGRAGAATSASAAPARRPGARGRPRRRVPPVPLARRGRRRQARAPDAIVPLELLDERRFGSGVVYLHYRVTA